MKTVKRDTHVSRVNAGQTNKTKNINKGVARGREFAPWIKVAGALALGAVATAALGFMTRRYLGIGHGGAIPDDIEFLSRHLHPGYQFDATGTSACMIDIDFSALLSGNTSTLKTLKQCTKELAAINHYLRNEKIDYSSKSDTFKGIPVQINNELFSIAHNPQKMRSYYNAAKYAKEKIVDSPNFFNLSNQKIIEEIQNIHSLLMEGSLQIFTPGKFRTICTWMYFANNIGDLEGRVEYARNKGAPENVLEILSKNFDFCNLSSEERKAFEYVATEGPHPEKIPSLMDDLVTRIKESARKDDNCLSLAADWHQGIGQAQAFNTANGRLGRLLEQMSLMLCGEGPVIFPNDDIYMQAAIADNNEPGAFRRFLILMIDWNKKYNHLLRA